MKPITITINGRKIKTRKGATVLEVALATGIRIPTLCHHENLSPYGGCRLCIVEVKGRRNPLTACTLVAEPGMVIRTDTERLRTLRRATLQLILSEHPNACLVCERESDCRNFQECIKKSAVTFGCRSCPQNEACELQDLAREFGIKDIPFEFRYRGLEPQRHDPFFDRDYNLCVLCGRCVRVCAEIRQAHTLEFHHRGPDTMVGTAFDLPHLESGCQFCGACVDVCPTGTLRDRFSRYDPVPDKKVRTTCLLCGMGCAIDLNLAAGKLTGTTPHPGPLCVRGRFAIAPLVNHPRRMTRPLVRKEHGLVEVGWDEALETTAQRLRAHRGRTGMLLSPQLTCEAIDRAYALADRLPAVLAARGGLAQGLAPVNLRQVPRHAAFIIVNTDLVSDYPVLLLALRKKCGDQAKFIAVDALGHGLSRYADRVFNPGPGTEQAVLEALLGKGRVRAPTGIKIGQIEEARQLLAGRPCYVIYDVSSFVPARDLRAVKNLRLSTAPNALKLARQGLDQTAEDMLQHERIDCLYLIDTPPPLPRKYRTVIAQGSFLPDCDLDIFLPAATFAELDGTMVDIEGRTKRLRRAIEPAGRSRSDEWILDELLQRLNLGSRVKRRKVPPSRRGPRAGVDRSYPLQLIVRDNTYHYRGTSLSRLLTGFERMRQDHAVWLNDRTAQRHKVRDGAMVRLYNREVSFCRPVRISAEVTDGVALVFADPTLAGIGNQGVRIECSKS